MASEFQKRVWEAVSLIPRGKVTTYKEIARFLNMKAYRAVGVALAKNPYAPKVPCHRVVKSNGEIGNYSAEGGVQKKAELLQKEGVEVKEGKIAYFEKRLYKLKE